MGWHAMVGGGDDGSPDPVGDLARAHVALCTRMMAWIFGGVGAQ